ncbi:MalY/PatB family protein [Kribbella sp. CA-293567]|uniref:MalY/PatB family protein n=1 Tax=Kribbella sp. CA-293567 TaxID=3002436 RepID=UPI0022DD54F6|nr:aminotransferase class I/II-fold pyridoxal phosphate-dependent enzyme [Kribbella sp. CA-293567]WBQ08213.1 aminotransferase class I/II-fold pyridoxal phosphate-dependent enzyme [Kribbella sp. CA-293567]
MPKVPALAELQQRRSEKWYGHGEGVIAATVAEMDFELAEPITAVLRDAIARSDLGYTSGVPSALGTAFAGFAQRRLNWQVDPDRLTLVPDVMIGLIELCRLIAPGGSIGFASAAYPPFLQQLPAAGFSLAPMPLLPDGSFDFDTLSARLQDGLDILILANPHNPTGRTLPEAELARIAELCAQYDVWVLADEIHAPLVLPGAEHKPWLEVSEAARYCGISLTSASKAFNLAGLKAALVINSSDRAQDLVRRLPLTNDQVGLLGVLAAEAAFTSGDEWLDDVLRQLDRNRTLIGEQLPTGIIWTPPQATFVAWLDCTQAGAGADPAAFFLEHARVALSQGRTYDPAATAFVRLNFGTGEELVTEMLTRMSGALRRQ